MALAMMGGSQLALPLRTSRSPAHFAIIASEARQSSGLAFRAINASMRRESARGWNWIATSAAPPRNDVPDDVAAAFTTFPAFLPLFTIPDEAHSKPGSGAKPLAVAGIHKFHTACKPTPGTAPSDCRVATPEAAPIRA